MNARRMPRFRALPALADTAERQIWYGEVQHRRTEGERARARL